MNKLSSQAFSKARTWLLENGRPLDRALFSLQFEGGSPDAVLEALGSFQNHDGGYGHRLEPDHNDDDSTVLNTTVALEIHRRLATPSDHPQVKQAMAYLVAQYDKTTRVWTIRPPVPHGEPGPPWFSVEAMTGSRVCPTAEVLGYLYDHLAGDAPDWLGEATDHMTEHVFSPSTQLEQHEVICAAHLLQSTGLPSRIKQPLQARLETVFPATLETDTSKWQHYVFRPTQIIDEPAHPLTHNVPADLMGADLDFEVDRIAEDGTWHPYWNWGPDSPEWQQSKRAWTSFLTERTLRVLASFGRIEDQ